MQAPIYTFKQYARGHFGGPIFRVPIDMGVGCPHRRGERGGCTFCPEDGARAVQIGDAQDLSAQIERSVEFARRRYGAERFMAYLQTYSNTWASIAVQADTYRRLLSQFPFDAISIGTRPDCLGPAVLDLLADLNDGIEVWIDLGVQSAHDATLRRVCRGHTWEDSRRAIVELAERGLHTAAHLIVGLPGESAGHFEHTAAELSRLPVSGVKLHNLHVVKDTVLAEEFARREFAVMDEYEYAEALMPVLRRLRSDLPVMRLVTDTPRERLVAPRWTMKKGEFETFLTRQMQLREYCQGDLCARDRRRPRAEYRLDPVATDDGSITFWNPDYNEHYHSPVGARTEAEQKYIYPSRLQQRLQVGPVRLLDICFGLGYNTLCACEAAAGAELEVTALEMDRRAVGLAAETLSEQGSTLDWGFVLRSIYTGSRCAWDDIAIEIEWGDARHTVSRLRSGGYDLVFLDAFSTQRNSQLWTLDFFRAVRNLMNPDAVLATYCAALPVRGGLMQAGFHVGESMPVGRKRGGTIAAMRAEDVEHPIAEEEMRKICESTRGLPYRDPYGCWSNSKILRQREMVRRTRKRSN